jgi:superfamily I DNA/RNA helicase
MQIVDDQTVILGPPGCGKTTTLLSIIERELEEGTPAGRIAFVSFTRKAVEEAVERACAKFQLEAKDFPNFRTLHSLCHRNINKGGREIFDGIAKKAFGNWLGIDFGSDMEDEETFGLTQATSKEDWCLNMINLARIRRRPLEEIIHAQRDLLATREEIRYMSAAYTAYRDDHSYMDYTDMIEAYINQGEPLDVDVVIIDEAQDLQPLLWEAARLAFCTAKRVYIAGDDDQAIHEWAGAEVEKFLTLTGKLVKLEQSYRIPRTVHGLSDRIISGIRSRFEKTFRPRSEEGSVEQVASIDYINPAALEGTTMLIARHVYQLDAYENLLRRSGIVYTRRGGANSIPDKDKDAIVGWERLRKGREVSGKTVATIYGMMRQSGCIERGYKTKVAGSLDQSLMYTMADLRRDWGMLTDAPWHEVLDKIGGDKLNYYHAVLRNGGGHALAEKPRFSVNTIHGVKGGEADNVILMRDISRRAFDDYVQHGDSERRVFYVAATRTRKNLLLLDPETTRFFTL